jgi:hypothetical protein
MSSLTYAGAATQMASSSGSRPASVAAARTRSTVQRRITGSASWRMKPSALRPTAASAFGP